MKKLLLLSAGLIVLSGCSLSKDHQHDLETFPECNDSPSARMWGTLSSEEVKCINQKKNDLHNEVSHEDESK